ncbi:NPC intracellular cholesterol transporter 2 [Diabrotica virgifera virgifera]|uniref:NPC intracellular cholesterol transporter 2-like n=1 Tax=Diabrotica virgifera virgifera TaxID=50390 RepID=A0A6P7FJS4_DIAVI|nr:NPC intracellular cholesterol transporter 2 [Diabrotica virgifera virgifera]
MESKTVLLNVVFLISILSVSQCLVNNLKASDCGSEDGSIINIDVSGCEGKDICPLQLGTNVTMVATFTSDVTSKSLTVFAYGKIGIFRKKFKLPNSNACDNDVSCPTSPNQTYNYTLTIFIEKNYPKIPVDVELHLKDDSNKDVFCALIPCHIVEALPVVVQII